MRRVFIITLLVVTLPLWIVPAFICLLFAFPHGEWREFLKGDHV